MAVESVVAPPRKAAFAFIFITVALDMLALGFIIPVLPKLVEEFMGGDVVTAATMVGLLSTTFAALQFFASPILGSLSDRFGRRPVVLLSNLGLGLDYIVMALAPTLGVLFLGRVLGGITSASVSTAGAYIGDVVPAEKRAQTFGMMGAAFGLGFILGPAIGGYLGSFDPRYPFWVAAGLSLLNSLYGFFVLPESLKPENRRKFSWAKANPFGSLKLLLSNRQLWSFGSAIFLSQLAHTVLPAIWVLYASYRYKWGPTEIGITLAAVGVASMIVQGGLVRPFVKRFGERNCAIFGLICGGLALIWYGTPSQGWMIWLGIPVAAFWGLFNACAQAIMSKQVGPQSQGQLQGANTSILSLSNIIGPSIFAYVFARGIDPKLGLNLPGAGFWLAGALLFLAALVTFVVTSGGRKDSKA